MKKNTLKQLKSDYEKLEITPSADLWDKLEQESLKMSDLGSKHQFQWWKYAAVVLLLISLGGLVYFNFNKTKESIVIAKSNETGNVETEKKENETAYQKIEPIQSENKVKISNSIQLGKLTEGKEISEPNEEIFKSNNQILVQKESSAIADNSIGNSEIVENKSFSVIDNPIVVGRKKTNYIKADDLLLGREIDKTREEARNEDKQFGSLDLNKIKLKSPNSFKLLGVTIFSDSLKAQ